MWKIAYFNIRIYCIFLTFLWIYFVGMVQLHGIKVSFSVNMKPKKPNLGGGQTVIYDEVLTNDGKGYDDRTGVFTSPVAGTYMFVVDALSRKPVWLRIYLNKTIVASLHISGSHSNSVYLQISRTVILKLRKGDHVKVVNDATHNGYVYHNGYSGFSGAKLYWMSVCTLLMVWIKNDNL